MGIIGSLFSAIKGLLGDLFSGLFWLLKTLGGWILDGIALLLRPVFELIGAIFYFLWKLCLLIVDVISVVLLIARLVFGLIVGGTRTILSLAYDGRPPDLGGMASQFEFLQPFVSSLKLDILAGIGAFAVWIITYYAAHRIISNFK
jgi:hypothetical protein